MKRKLLFGLLGLGPVTFLVRKIRKEINRHLYKDQEIANIWMWMVTLWETSAQMNGLVTKIRFKEQWWCKKLGECVDDLDLRRNNLPIDFTKEYWEDAFGAVLNRFDQDREDLRSAISSEDPQALRQAAKNLTQTCTRFDEYFVDRMRAEKRTAEIDTPKAS